MFTRTSGLSLTIAYRRRQHTVVRIAHTIIGDESIQPFEANPTLLENLGSLK